MRGIRTILLFVLCAAAAVLTVALCAYGLDAEPLLLSEPAAPEETVKLFLDAVCAGDAELAKSCCDGWTYAEAAPDDQESAAVYALLQERRSWAPLAPAEREGTHARQRVQFRSLDLRSMTGGLKEDVDRLLASYVESARVTAEIYDDEMNYLPEVVQRAWEEALQARMDAAESYMRTAELTLELQYRDQTWLVEYCGELIPLLSGGV